MGSSIHFYRISQLSTNELKRLPYTVSQAYLDKSGYAYNTQAEPKEWEKLVGKRCNLDYEDRDQVWKVRDVYLYYKEKPPIIDADKLDTHGLDEDRLLTASDIIEQKTQPAFPFLFREGVWLYQWT